MKIIIEDIPLKDNGSSYGGKSHANETLAEFIQDGAEPLSYRLDHINGELAACGLEPITIEQIKIVDIEEDEETADELIEKIRQTYKSGY